MRAPWRSSPSTKRPGEMLGVVRLHADANYETRRIRHPGALRPQGPRARLAADADDHRVCARRRPERIEGQVLRENTTMLDMCRELGFEVASDPEEADVQVVKLRL